MTTIMIQKEFNIDEDYFITINKKHEEDVSIFNQSQFISIHENDFSKVFSFCLYSRSKSTCLGVANFASKKQGVYISPIAGSFGGFEFKEHIPLLIKEAFIEFVINFISNKDNECTSIEIIFQPDIYNIESNSELLSILFRLGFLLNDVEINQFINVNEYQKDLSVSYGNRKRINKCIRQGIQFKRLSRTDYKEAYNVILSNRKRNNYSISMTWDSILKMLKHFEDKFFFFGLYKDQTMIASSISINVSPQILYVFYWGEIDGQQTLSPVSYLSTRIVEFCLDNDFTILDLGTSSINTAPNYGLIKFKKAIGANSCNKIKLLKSL